MQGGVNFGYKISTLTLFPGDTTTCSRTSLITSGYNNVFQNITDNVALHPLDKTQFPSTKFLGSYKIPDRSAPTMSVDGNFELIDSNLIFKKWIPFEKKICFVAGTQSPSNLGAYMALVVKAYDHNSALETDAAVFYAKNVHTVAPGGLAKMSKKGICDKPACQLSRFKKCDRK